MQIARTNTKEGLDVTSQRRSDSPEFKADYPVRDTRLTVHWPLSPSAQCVHMLRELLQ